MTEDSTQSAEEEPKGAVHTALSPHEYNKTLTTPKIFNRKKFYEGDHIFKQGKEASNAYYIEEGTVEVYVEKDGRRISIAELHAGDIFGEMALIENNPERSANILALEDTTVTIITKDDLEAMMSGLQDNPLGALCKTLVKRLRRTTDLKTKHYKDLTDFSDRMLGLIGGGDLDLPDTERQAFREEVTPLLIEVEKVLSKYRPPKE